jgi:hypothetical protein
MHNNGKLVTIFSNLIILSLLRKVYFCHKGTKKNNF